MKHRVSATHYKALKQTASREKNNTNKQQKNQTSSDSTCAADTTDALADRLLINKGDNLPFSLDESVENLGNEKFKNNNLHSTAIYYDEDEYALKPDQDHDEFLANEDNHTVKNQG